MKKITIAIAIITTYFFTSCSIFHKDRYGCPKSSASIGAEKLASGDPAATKLANKHKFRVNTGKVWH